MRWTWRFVRRLGVVLRRTFEFFRAEARRTLRREYREDGRLVAHVDRTWSSDHALGVEGWIASAEGPIDGAVITCEGQRADVDVWSDRQEVLQVLPGFAGKQARGFTVQIPRRAPHLLELEVCTGGRILHWSDRVAGTSPPPPSDLDSPVAGAHHPLFLELVREVNEKGHHVLEIGSRVHSPGSASKRDLFPEAASFLGFDRVGDANTDVVGDVHRLTDHLDGRRFGAIFSLSVLEHLAMPWLAVLEMSRALEVGGITFHWTTFAWPLHDEPEDYWRFSDQALRILFAPELGFEVMGTVMADPARMVPDVLRPGFEGLPTMPAPMSSGILARKRAEPDLDGLRWPRPAC